MHYRKCWSIDFIVCHDCFIVRLLVEKKYEWQWRERLKLSPVWEHFSKNKQAKQVQASSKLKTKQKQMGTSEHKLVQDVSTRWNSTYYMMTHLLEHSWPLSATLSDPAVIQRGKQFLDIKADQWNLLEELAKGVQVFECATVYSCGESYVTASSGHWPFEVHPHCLLYSSCAGLSGSCFSGGHCTLVKRVHRHRW